MIPLFRPSCTDLEVKYVTEVLRSGWWGMGPRVTDLEEEFTACTGTLHGVAVSSCTAALQVTLEAAGATGGEVIVPALTFVATALAALHAGNRVVFADIDEDTLCLDWADAEAKRTPLTKAVIPVWYAGRVGTVPPGWPLVIEDCAHAAGAPGAGQQGHAACWSFHAVKNLAAGDGGMITTGNTELAAKARRLRLFGIDRSAWERDKGQSYSWEYGIAEPGHKAYMNDITAALALAQLERLDAMNAARRMIVYRYLDGLGDLGWLRLPAPRSAHHLFAVRVDAERRDAFISHMLSEGVTAGVHYRPASHYPVFGPRQPLPVTDRVWRELVTLPLYPDMTGAEISQVITAVRGFQPARGHGAV